MLKMLVLKMVKKYINIYKYKLSLFGRDDTKQTKSLLCSIFIVVPQIEQFPKVQKTKKMKKKMTLDVARTYNNSNYKLT